MSGLKVLRNSSALLAAMVLVGCAALAEAPKSELQYRQVHEVDLSQEEIFDRTQEWFAMTFVDSNQVIELANEDTGKIIGKGVVDINIGLVAEPVRMTITVESKPNRYRTTYSNYTMYSQGNPISVRTSGTAAKVNQEAKSLDASLASYLMNGSLEQEDW